MKKINSQKSTYLIISKEEAMDATKVCIANSLFLLQISQYIHKGELESRKVSFNFDTHGQFCTITIR